MFAVCSGIIFDHEHVLLSILSFRGGYEKNVVSTAGEFILLVKLKININDLIFW